MGIRTRAWLAAGLTLALLAGCRSAGAREIWSSEDGERTVDLVSALKESTVISDDGSLVGLWRLRFGLDARLSHRSTVEFAYEQRLRTIEEAASQGLVVLPSQVDAPYRIAQLDNAISATDAYSYRHELDRALVALHYERADVTIGRQAVGWGRGVLFSAIDVFSPFSPLEVDREWRRGIDAVRADVRLTDLSSLDVVGAFGESWDDSALLGRYRGRTESGLFDGEVIFGKRAQDTMVAGAFAATVWEAEVHGELALFNTPEEFADGRLFDDANLVTKAVLGASYTFDVGNGLTVWAEYHYSGFGSDDMEQAAARLQDADYLERYLRGDTQILGRRAVGLQAQYLIDDMRSVSLLWVANADDGSGVVAPVMTWDLAARAVVTLSVYFPYGDGLDEAGVPRSEYGIAATTAFLQLRLYD